MQISKLQYITNGDSETSILNEVKAAVDAKIDWVQLRIKDPNLDFLSIAEKVKKICKNKAVLIINDDIEIALTIDADGVHLGLDDTPIQQARKMLGRYKIIGGTANTLTDCLNRQADGADYIGLGPYRNTTTKSKLSPILGLNGYETILPLDNGEIYLPVVAIGGILVEDIDELMQKTRVHGIAVSGLIKNATDKKKLVGQIHKKLKI
jgi:thiamine-phosphate pyrophosphorylase